MKRDKKSSKDDVVDPLDLPYSNNICFSIVPDLKQNDERLEKYKRQRQSNGFDDTETWNLFKTIAQFTLPRLKRYKEVNNGVPCDYTEESYNADLDKIIKAFELIIEDDIKTEEEYAPINIGLDLFRKHFMDLWW